MSLRSPLEEIRLPAAKRQRLEAALTLDLSRVEALESYDWTSKPLEPGALLQLGEVVPELDSQPLAVPLLELSNCEGGKKDGWLPPFQVVEVQEVREVLDKELPEVHEVPVEPAVKRMRHELLQPGMVYGYDRYPSGFEETSEQFRPHLKAGDYVEMMDAACQPADHMVMGLRLLVDPESSLYLEPAGAPPEMQSLLSGEPADVPTEVEAYGAYGAYSDDAEPLQDVGKVEAQDDRTAEVGEMIRQCLATGGGRMSFEGLVPLHTDRSTAGLTFAALLALASAGELQVQQTRPFEAIVLAA